MVKQVNCAMLYNFFPLDQSDQSHWFLHLLGILADPMPEFCPGRLKLEAFVSGPSPINSKKKLKSELTGRTRGQLQQRK